MLLLTAALAGCGDDGGECNETSGLGCPCDQNTPCKTSELRCLSGVCVGAALGGDLDSGTSDGSLEGGVTGTGGAGTNGGAGITGSGGSGGESGGTGGSGGGGGGGGDASVEPPVSCDAPNLLCGDECVPSDPTNCGSCGHACTNLPHVVPDAVSCDADTCVVPATACTEGYAHCTANVDDGCETPISLATSCGDCTTTCGGLTPLCANVAADAADPPDYQCVDDCPAGTPTQCGDSCVDTDTSVLHCSGCDKPCLDPDNGEPTCDGGVCGITCAPNHHPCGDTCQPDAAADACGPSCTTCTAPSDAKAVCVADKCDFTCNSTHHRCGNTCELNTSVTACGSGCATCTAPAMGTPECNNGSCDFTCSSTSMRVGNICVENECNVNGDCNDSRSCTTDTCDPTAKTCSNTLNSNRCLISGTCRTGGEKSPSNDCMSCQPSSSTSAYTPVSSGTTCSPSSHDIIMPTCDGSGKCGTPYCDIYACHGIVQTGQALCNVDGSQVPCTSVAGQPACASISGCGQDAEYGNNVHNYSVSGGIITDTATGLKWQQTPGDCDFSTNNAEECNHTNAVGYCSFLTLGGLSGWRLPTVEEYLEILNPAVQAPATSMPNMPSVFTDYWTATSVAGDTTYAWDVSFSLWAAFGRQNKTDGLAQARCVNGTPRVRTTANRFSEESVGGGTVVYDRSTKLTWQRTPSTGKTWLQALNYCEGLNYAGSTDWRVPDLNELASLFDFTKTSAPLSSMPGTGTKGYWSSSWAPYAQSPGFARQVIFDKPADNALTILVIKTGQLIPPVVPWTADAAVDVRCVRGP